VSCITGRTLGREFGNRVLRDILEIKREEVTGDWRKYTLRSFMICAAHQTFRGLSERECNWRGMWHVLGRREIVIGVLLS